MSSPHHPQRISRVSSHRDTLALPLFQTLGQT
jgi:hypothetical protein